MRVWRALDEVDVGAGERSVVTVGVFDGVHRGHRHVIDGVIGRARELGATAVVVTFDPHPMSVVRPGQEPLQVSTVEHRLALLDDEGVDAVLVLPFTSERAQQSAADFVGEVLAGALHAIEVHVGENFRFGHRAAGTVDTLRELGPAYGFQVRPVALAGDARTWSSTYVREHLAEGDVEGAAATLGRPHRLEGPVVEGDKRGRELGYPTANLDVGDGAAVPSDGIYAGWLVLDDGRAMPAAISIGTNPTFGGTTRRVEGYVLDRDDLELYGEHVALDFAHRLRDTLHFDDVDGLLAQIADDVRRTRELTA
ncbi:MAG: bifunctional riboflavin kinase/FAD synthetase [Actinomycetes bacterium]